MPTKGFKMFLCSVNFNKDTVERQSIYIYAMFLKPKVNKQSILYYYKQTDKRKNTMLRNNITITDKK